ncbi:hypothetical protein L226DRAFT_614321 [Lentinus tigrinus ALCF2SS1-7]|uniref:Uncharacterized protein n=1 Tax=Lentinus tigrinus ALCF2SS1-6 TaxID=1328759 RepID=A0A5C2S1J6_9APHY|nr:hypothetical protein L227DRAFT_655687 [Lentinus tigrinus ALCF2SS1-6]RPD73056.1 hypothetical protein L226DRAFT_614321 [Lentinus tigrinus ALCF2SS1-7]
MFVVHSRLIDSSFVNYLRLQARHREHPHDLQENISHTTTPKSNDRLSAIIGAAAAGSAVLLIVVIFLSYWFMKRRRRRCPPSQMWITESPKRLALEAPRKARKHSIVLSLLSPTLLTRPKPLWLEKPLPSPPLTASLLSSHPSSAASTTTFSSVKVGWPYSEKSPSLLNDASLVTSPPPTHTKLGLVRMLPVEKAKSIDDHPRTVLVAQEVDSGVRLVDQVVVPPPYTYR